MEGPVNIFSYSLSIGDAVVVSRGFRHFTTSKKLVHTRMLMTHRLGFDPPSTSESERQNLSFAVQTRRLQTSQNPGGLKYRNEEPQNNDWLTSEL
jgi:hypothetical protein